MSQALVKVAFSSITGNSIVKKNSVQHRQDLKQKTVQNTLAHHKATGLSHQCLGRGILTPCQSELLHKRSNNSICYYRKPHQHLLNRDKSLLKWTSLSLCHRNTFLPTPLAVRCLNRHFRVVHCTYNHRAEARTFIGKHKDTNVVLLPPF